MRARILNPIDLTLALRRARAEAENAELHLRLRAAQDRIEFLEDALGCERGEQVAPLRARRGWWSRLTRFAKPRERSAKVAG